MPSGCVLLDAVLAVPGDADIVQCKCEKCEERCTTLHMLDGAIHVEE